MQKIRKTNNKKTQQTLRTKFFHCPTGKILATKILNSIKFKNNKSLSVISLYQIRSKTQSMIISLKYFLIYKKKNKNLICFKAANKFDNAISAYPNQGHYESLVPTKSVAYISR